MRVATRRLDGAYVVEVEGELGPWTVETFQNALLRAVKECSGAVILDMTRVRIVDISALKPIEQAMKAMHRYDELCASVNLDVKTVLEIARFDGLVNALPKVGEALKSYVREPKTAT